MSFSWLDGSGCSELALQPSTQPRERSAKKSQKLARQISAARRHRIVCSTRHGLTPSTSSPPAANSNGSDSCTRKQCETCFAKQMPRLRQGLPTNGGRNTGRRSEIFYLLWIGRSRRGAMPRSASRLLLPQQTPGSLWRASVSAGTGALGRSLNSAPPRERTTTWCCDVESVWRFSLAKGRRLRHMIHWPRRERWPNPCTTPPVSCVPSMACGCWPFAKRNFGSLWR